MQVVSQKKFKTDPHLCARGVWEGSNRYLAANGAVMRTSILGVANFDDISTVITNTKKICHVTHADPRCAASCVAVTTCLALMLKNGVSDISSIIKEALNFGIKELDPNDKGIHGVAEFEKHHTAKSLEELKLDDSSSIGYTYKCSGSAFYTLANGTDFKEAICKLVREAGDADTNAAVAGALLGCKVGYNALPKDWLNGLKEKKWLDAKVARLLGMLGLDENEEVKTPSEQPVL